MSRTSQTSNTLNHVQALLAKDSKTIMKRENINGNRVHLYGVGQYWAAFDKSAFLLEKMTKENCGIVILHLKDHPFPILMYCVHYEKVKDLCRKYMTAKKGLEYLQFITHPADEESYYEWYRGHVIEEY